MISFPREGGGKRNNYYGIPCGPRCTLILHKALGAGRYPLPSLMRASRYIGYCMYHFIVFIVFLFDKRIFPKFIGGIFRIYF